MPARSIFVSLISIAIVSLTLGATKEVAEPIAPPYASERKLLSTDFERLEWKDTKRNTDVPVKIYFPTEGAGPFPVIIFSHGLGGTREGYEYLGRQWAANGFVVIHLQHPGSDDSAWRGQERPMQSMKQAANGRNAYDRCLDVNFTIDQLESLNSNDPKLKGKLDVKSIGMSGHSFGGNTTMLEIGQRLSGGPLPRNAEPTLRNDHIVAAIAMSPPVPLDHENLDDTYNPIRVPLFVMTGTKDDSPIGNTKAKDRRMPFDHGPNNTAPKYLLTLTDGDHMVFSGRLTGLTNREDEKFQKQIRLSSTAFWDAYLKHDDAAKKWLDDEGGFKQELGAVGVLEHKGD